MKRITDTLRQGHPDYNAAVKALNKVIFAWSTQDVAEVKLALNPNP